MPKQQFTTEEIIHKLERGRRHGLSAIRDRKHEEHDSMLEWIGGAFDPEGFDLNAINRNDPKG